MKNNRTTALIAMFLLAVVGGAAIFVMSPPQPRLWGGLLVLAVGLGVSVVSYMRKRNTARMLTARESISDAEIYRRFYFNSSFDAAQVQELWHEVANALGLPVDKLRPTDRFGSELGGKHLITTDDLDVLADVARRRAKRCGLVIDLPHMQTLDDYVRAFLSDQRAEEHR
jgi:hypothetical protein